MKKFFDGLESILAMVGVAMTVAFIVVAVYAAAEDLPASWILCGAVGLICGVTHAIWGNE